MKVLGISGGLLVNMHDSAAVLVEDGKIIAAAEEERFSRAKYGRGELPERAARWMIKKYGAPDMIAYHCQGAPWMVPRIRDWGIRKLGLPKKVGVRLFDHHKCHAASAFYPSPFDEANILTMDNSGDGLATTLSYGHGEDIHPLDEYAHPQSLGLFYMLVTDHLGYSPDADEYHIMGASAYGDPSRFDKALSKVLQIEHSGYLLDPDYVKQYEGCKRGHQERIVSDLWVDTFGPRRMGEFTQDHMDFAASAQSLFEKCVTNLVERLYNLTGIRNLVLAGGCAMNCRANQVLRENGIVDNLWVQPASSDAGAALGAALLVDEKRVAMDHAYLGPEIPGKIDANGIDNAADRLCRGAVIGWAQGRMEYGPRALGNRSILSLPRGQSKVRVSKIKGREQFRPFAPVIPEEFVDMWFDGGGTWSMTQTFNASPNTKEMAPAIVHEDGTSRVQVVTPESNRDLHRLLCKVEERTGCPILLNTSLNRRGEPIVRTRDDATAMFYATNIDTLYVGNERFYK